MTAMVSGTSWRTTSMTILLWWCTNERALAALLFASKVGASWAREIVDTGSVGEYASLALDAQGNPRIAYFDATNADLKFASKVGASWAREIVDATGNVGEYASLVLDAQGNPRIAYHDATNADLKFASKIGTSWARDIVDATGIVGLYASLVLDAQGNPRIASYGVPRHPTPSRSICTAKLVSRVRC